MNIITLFVALYFAVCLLILVVKSCWGRAHKYSKFSRFARRFLIPYDTLLSIIFTPFLIVDEIIKRF